MAESLLCLRSMEEGRSVKLDTVSISACGKKHAGVQGILFCLGFLYLILKVKPMISSFGNAFLKSNIISDIKHKLISVY